MDPLIATAIDAPSEPAPPSPSTEPPAPARLWAISDLHLSFKANREELEKLEPKPNDGLILCGDVGETAEHLRQCFATAVACFLQVWWVPGNHELYTIPSSNGRRGEYKYKECVAIAREYGVLTPEDDFVVWEGDGGPVIIAPIFTLYDYSFRPDYVPLEEALEWANEEDILATDETLLHNDPYASRIEWCNALVERAKTKLAGAVMQNLGTRLVIINHWPLREDLVNIPLVPRFVLWCGTKQTEYWHNIYNAKVVVSGHLHVRRTDWIDETRFEEVSLGYPKQWHDCLERGLNINDLLREILPGSKPPPLGQPTTLWRRYGKGTTDTPPIFRKGARR
jgi:predicted phosphodiesterase